MYSPLLRILSMIYEETLFINIEISSVNLKMLCFWRLYLFSYVSLCIEFQHILSTFSSVFWNKESKKKLFSGHFSTPFRFKFFLIQTTKYDVPAKLVIATPNLPDIRTDWNVFISCCGVLWYKWHKQWRYDHFQLIVRNVNSLSMNIIIMIIIIDYLIIVII